MTTAKVSLEASDVAFSYGNGRVLDGLSLRIHEGEFVAIIGPNGCGKTTLLRVLSGILSVKNGHVWLASEEIRRLPRQEIARRVAVVPQELHMPFAFTVEQIVSMGRTPYIRPLRGEQAADREAVTRALEATDTERFRHRLFPELSGGERQRVVVAMALAQEPEILLLDEPTVHLDITHQVEILDLVRSLNRNGLTAVAVMHDLNLAALYFDRLVLMQKGRIVVSGRADDVLTQQNLAAVFNTNVQILPHPLRQVPQVAFVPGVN